MPSLPWMAGAGAAVGILFGLFGVGGSALATPLLSLLGVPPLIAVASPLPATLGSAFSGLAGYARRKKIDWRVARLSIAGGLPAAVVGSLLSDAVGGRRLLFASGLVLAVVGVRVLRPLGDGALAKAEQRRNSGWLVVCSVAGVGFVTGLLANGGGFLLVPLFLLVLGLSMPESTGTSLAVIAALAVPTLITHTSLGHVAWPVAAAFAMGSIPASFVGAELAHRINPGRLKTSFGWMLILFAGYFLLRQV